MFHKITGYGTIFSILLRFGCTHLLLRRAAPIDDVTSSDCKPHGPETICIHGQCKLSTDRYVCFGGCECTQSTHFIQVLKDLSKLDLMVVLYGISTTRTQDTSYPGQLVPRTRQLVPRTTRAQDNSYPWQLVHKTTITQDDSYPGQLVPRTTRTQDDSFQAQVVPRTTLPKLYPGQLVSRTSRNYSQIMTILSKTFPLP